MGCSQSSSAGGCKDPGKDVSDDSTSQEEKHRNYGGVYVGLPTDTTTSSDTKGAEDPMQLNALNTRPGSSLPENVC
ncbi:overexpressed in colon carcinoma 1 protein [Dendropsophus ebraccatus]|uniref:overexpressed in colon carcinoma 1 protein n=1 Tax=Dendropsophus ebraccatus TaxID=150705 RepID=UPI003831EAB9